VPGSLSSARTLWLLFALFIVYACTIPFHFVGGLAGAIEKLRALPLSPLISPATGGRVSLSDVAQNVLLFLPFGVLGVTAVPDSRRTIARIVTVTALGCALSVFVECLQLFTSDRVTAVSDVAANTTGTFIGAVVALGTARSVRRLLERARVAGLTASPAFELAALGALLVAIAAWEPFDVTLDVGTIVSKLHALSHDIWQAGVPTDEGIAVVHYALLGAALTAWLEAIGSRRANLQAALAGVTLAVGLEASQLFISSRMPGLEDALVRATGALVGVACWGAAKRDPRPMLWLTVMVVATTVAAAMQELSPFQLAQVYRPMRLVPFLSDYEHTSFETLSHVLELGLLYAPMGFLFAYLAGPGRTGRLQALVWAFVIALPVECLQGWIPGRYADITDVGLSLVGAWAGAEIGCWIRARATINHR
jgi:glycopeptide antibiotics resistance protein